MTSRAAGPRGLRALLALVLAAGAVIAPAVPAAACACGVAPAPRSDVAVGEERAIVSWRGGVEQIDLQLTVLSTDSEAGLIVPTPSPATVSLGDRADFAAIERVTTPRRVEEYDWWSFRAAGDGASGGAPPEVLDVVQLGPLEATTLAAADTAGLQAWLVDNDYALSPEVTALLGDYIDRGWSFVALELTGDAPLDGVLDPLRFTFESDRLVYPLVLSRAATSPQTLRLFVFADHRQRIAFTGTGTPAASFTSWAAPVTDTEVAGFGDFLTVHEFSFAEPNSQILGDLEFVDGPTDAPTGTEDAVVVPVALLGIPLGWLLTGFAAAGALVTLLVVGAVGAKRS